MTKKLCIEKAEPTPGRPPIGDVFISIHSSGIFQETPITSASVCQADAEDLHEALHDSLPQATFNRLTALMLRTCAGSMIRPFEPETKER